MTKFAVSLPEVNTATGAFYKKSLIDTITTKYPHLSVAGLDDPFYTRSGKKKIRGVEYAGPGNLLTFGTAKDHDINWVERANYACSKGYQPIYDLVKDYNTILNKLDVFAKERKPVCSQPSNKYGITINVNINGTPVEVYDNFIKIGYTIIPRSLTTELLMTYEPKLVKEITYLVQSVRNF